MKRFLPLSAWQASLEPQRVSLAARIIKNLPTIEPAWDLGSICGSGRSPGERNGNPLQYSCQKNPMDRGSWQAVFQSVANSWTWLSDWTHTHIHTHTPLLISRFFAISNQLNVLPSFDNCVIYTEIFIMSLENNSLPILFPPSENLDFTHMFCNG